MNKIRHSVFETNSSSSHSLTITSKNLAPMPFPRDVMREGKVYIPLGEYGWEWRRMYRLEHKLSYLFTQLLSEVPENKDAETVTQEVRNRNPRIDTLCRIVGEHTGVQVLMVPGSTGYIDHESQGVGIDAEFFNNEAKLRQFLFSDKNYVQLGNDNCDQPMLMSTDKGVESEHSYRNCYRMSSGHSVPVTLVYRAYYRELFTENGADLFAFENRGLLSTMAKSSTVATAHVVKTSGYRGDSTPEQDELQAELARALLDIGFKFDPSLKVSYEHEVSKHYGKEVSVTFMCPRRVARRLVALAPSPSFELGNNR
ncbi:hypothetical protein LC612_29270 [Nostoc sp. CHAB 5834]|nr:hypothetical protein [Nostoc sp. CHAB 5834]